METYNTYAMVASAIRKATAMAARATGSTGNSRKSRMNEDWKPTTKPSCRLVIRPGHIASKKKAQIKGMNTTSTVLTKSFSTKEFFQLANKNIASFM